MQSICSMIFPRILQIIGANYKAKNANCVHSPSFCQTQMAHRVAITWLNRDVGVNFFFKHVTYIKSYKPSQPPASYTLKKGWQLFSLTWFFFISWCFPFSPNVSHQTSMLRHILYMTVFVLRRQSSFYWYNKTQFSYFC